MIAAATPPDVAAVNLADRIAILDNDEVVPITDLYDQAGDETDDEEIACAAVAGPSALGLWYAIDFRNFGWARRCH